MPVIDFDRVLFLLILIFLIPAICYSTHFDVKAQGFIANNRTIKPVFFFYQTDAEWIAETEPVATRLRSVCSGWDEYFPFFFVKKVVRKDRRIGAGDSRRSRKVDDFQPPAPGENLRNIPSLSCSSQKSRPRWSGRSMAIYITPHIMEDSLVPPLILENTFKAKEDETFKNRWLRPYGGTPTFVLPSSIPLCHKGSDHKLNNSIAWKKSCFGNHFLCPQYCLVQWSTSIWALH